MLKRSGLLPNKQCRRHLTSDPATMHLNIFLEIVARQRVRLATTRSRSREEHAKQGGIMVQSWCKGGSWCSQAEGGIMLKGRSCNRMIQKHTIHVQEDVLSRDLIKRERYLRNRDVSPAESTSMAASLPVVKRNAVRQTCTPQSLRLRCFQQRGRGPRVHLTGPKRSIKKRRTTLTCDAPSMSSES